MTSQPTTAYAHTESEETYSIAWEEVENELELAQMYWITSLQDGVPHSVPVIGIWFEGALYS